MSQTAPYWAPNAIATTQGWVDPKTGELLMAITGLTVTETSEPTPEEVPPATE